MNHILVLPDEFETKLNEAHADSDIHEIRQRDGTGGHFDLLMAAIIGLFKAGSQSVDKHTDEKIDKFIKDKAKSMFTDSGNNL